MKVWKRALVIVVPILAMIALIRLGGLSRPPQPLGEDHVGPSVILDMEPLIGIGVSIDYDATLPVIVRVLPGSPARAVGLLAGDVILKVDGRSTAGRTEEDIQAALKGNGKPWSWVRISVVRIGRAELLELEVPRRTLRHEAYEVEGIGVTFDDRHEYGRYYNLRVSDVTPGSPADKTGLKAGDVIVAIDGRDAVSCSQGWAIGMIRGQPGTAVALLVRRGLPDAASEPPSEADAAMQLLQFSVTRERFWAVTVLADPSDWDK